MFVPKHRTKRALYPTKCPIHSNCVNAERYCRMSEMAGSLRDCFPQNIIERGLVFSWCDFIKLFLLVQSESTLTFLLITLKSKVIHPMSPFAPKTFSQLYVYILILFQKEIFYDVYCFQMKSFRIQLLVFSWMLTKKVVH